MNLRSSFPHVSLACLPTPLHQLPALGKRIGLQQLLVKRDDLTGLAAGGNKARKLEFELAPAIAGGHDCLVTVGGKQSNHACMVAAAARKLGVECKLVLGGNPITALEGNLLLNGMLGAEIRYINGSDDDNLLAMLMAAWVTELKQAGHNPYPLPLGGSTALGSLGYVAAMQELAEQLSGAPPQIILPVGSCGTLAGCALGAALFMPAARVFGISVSRTKENIIQRTTQLIAGCANLLGVASVGVLEKVTVYDTFHHSYAEPVPEAENAIAISAAEEGLLLDSIYTGKAMYGLMQLAEAGVLNAAQPVVFLHTGGLPIVFTRQSGNSGAIPFRQYSVQDVMELA